MNSFCVSLASLESSDPTRVGPKAANLAALGRAGLRIPDGFCLGAEAYRRQVAALGLEEAARGVFASDTPSEARQHALRMKLGLLEEPIAPAILEGLLEAWRDLTDRTGALTVVRSSALVEDRFGSSFAGQFESYLGLEREAEFLTAVRACWAALWSTRALRYMATHSLDPADTAMAVLVQPLVAARAAGGGLSRTADGGMLVNATMGLGASIAQGEVTPDRFELDRDGSLLHVAPGRKDHALRCGHRRAPTT
jgi:pyruvate,water dikinase